jgi:hypothetical protein
MALFSSVMVGKYFISLNLNLLRSIPFCSLGTPVSYTNKTDSHAIAEILLNEAQSTLTLTLTLVF